MEALKAQASSPKPKWWGVISSIGCSIKKVIEGAAGNILGELAKPYVLPILAYIEWNLGALVGAAILLNNPSVVNRLAVPTEVFVDGLGLNGPLIIGLDLAAHERKDRIREVLSLAHRCLICESTELAADFLFRAARILQGQNDPYLGNDRFGVNLVDLSNQKQGKSGSLISSEQRNFMSTCAVELRCLIRHNNARLLPHKSVVYAGTPAQLPIAIDQQWLQGSSNELNISLKISHDIFSSVSWIVQSGLTAAMSEGLRAPHSNRQKGFT